VLSSHSSLRSPGACADIPEILYAAPNQELLEFDVRKRNTCEIRKEIGPTRAEANWIKLYCWNS